jgi:TolB-like protein
MNGRRGVLASNRPTPGRLAVPHRRVRAASSEVKLMDYLDQSERTRLEELRLVSPFVREALEQLARILASPKFCRVQQKAKDLLGFVVSKALLGQADHIKETTLAIYVFHEPADFNPAESAKVRVAAGDVRRRLAAYAEDEGQDDPIEIVMPLNTYVPDIRDRRPSVIVSELENWQSEGDQQHVALALTAEIAYLLNRAGIRIQPQGGGVMMAPSYRRYRLRGSIEGRDDVLKVNLSLARVDTGRIVLSRSFGGRRDECFKLASTITAALLKALKRIHHAGQNKVA